MNPVDFENVSPILRVASLAASLTYYVEILGFTIAWQDPGGIACVSRGRCSIFLCEGDQGHPGAWVWIGVSDVDALQAEVSQRGAIIRLPPANYPWALEMHVEDPDGSVLRFGSEPRENEPFGDWLDMRGKRWPVH